MDRSDAELSILVTDDEEIRSLNRAYRGIDSPTDVLSFSQSEGEEIPGGSGLLGDIVISLDSAVCQAVEIGHPVGEEMRRLLVHGVLHLIGYDHVKGGEESVRMRAAEEKYLSLAYEPD
ncbi:MAG: rRNA maturation RNase YbeY [bacterium]|nr:rRNA maturation RNase YbeY [bacterium]MDT8396484.1 rRNA maturation RNase YbeY [bacterium]